MWKCFETEVKPSSELIKKGRERKKKRDVLRVETFLFKKRKNERDERIRAREKIEKKKAKEIEAEENRGEKIR